MPSKQIAVNTSIRQSYLRGTLVGQQELEPCT